MKKSDIFKRILAVVSDICECTPQQICSPAKPQRLVDARSIAVHFLHAAGFTFNEISDYSYECNYQTACAEGKKCKSKSIASLYVLYDQRYKENFSFRLMASEVKAILMEQYNQEFTNL